WTGHGLLFYGGSYYPQELDSTAYYIPPFVRDAPASIFSQPRDITVLEGHSASFRVIADGSQPISYQWFFGANSITDATNATLQFNSVQMADAGLYRVSLSNSFGTDTSREARLTVIHPLATYDLVAAYSTSENPAGIWIYVWKS